MRHLPLLVSLGAIGLLACTPPPTISDTFAVRASVEQLHIWDGPVEVGYEVLDASGEVVAEALSDYQGSLVVRDLVPGPDHTVRLADDPDDLSDQLEVMSIEGSLPDPTFYEQQLQIGNGYLTTRDGTQLSYFLSLPGPIEEGPYPTLVNYSGYSPGRPGEIVSGTEAYCEIYPILCDAPSFPTGLIAGMLGYAVIGVNMRGTGCSGGAYDYFEPLQSLDGYDVIEIVSRQGWVKHGQVGMVGLSYPGITQLFVGRTRPPGLAAIAPFSVIADTASSTLVPGGIYNNGFALQWIEHVLDKAEPYGHGWIQDVVDAGDVVCEEHQLLHSQKLDAIAKALENPYYSDEVAKPLDPSSFVHEVDVPVFLTGQWQDEQTGPHFPALFDKFTSAPVRRFTATNGVHMDGFAPQILVEWATFLDLYVAREVPYMPAAFDLMVPIFMVDVFGDDLSLPDGRFEDYASWEDAVTAYEAEGDVRVIFESGAADGVEPGAPVGTFEATFDSWPIEGTVPTRWHLQPGGDLADHLPPAGGGDSSFVHDPDAGVRGTLASGSVNPIQPDWHWPQPLDGSSLSFVTEPYTEDVVLLGHGSVDLWLKSSATDADLEVTIAEIRPDGMETLIQSGWLRASHRALRSDATELRPVKSHYEADIAPLEPDTWTPVRVEVMPHGQVMREGSRLRLDIDTPGDSMASWRFLLTDFDEPPTYTIGHDAEHPSSLILSVVPDLDVPPERPPCYALRGQPCREHLP
jgi:uncharacterized protein